MSKIEKNLKKTKTTFSVSEEAVNDLNYIVENHSLTIQEILDYICEAFNSYNNDMFFNKNNFLTLTVQGAENLGRSKKVRKSWNISKRSLVILKKITKNTELTRNNLLDSGIQTYRSFMDCTHPVVKDELYRYRDLLKQLSSFEFYIHNNLSIPHCNSVFENDPNDRLKVDIFQDAVEKHFATVNEFCEKSIL